MDCYWILREAGIAEEFQILRLRVSYSNHMSFISINKSTIIKVPKKGLPILRSTTPEFIVNLNIFLIYVSSF